MTEKIITQDELKRHVSYDPETGTFLRLIANARRVKVGDIAGRIYPHGYRQICINSKSYAEHRLAFLYVNGEWPKNQVDHINGIKDDNRWCNLREATRNENLYNIGKYPRNKSGFKGVDFVRSLKKWQARITVNGERIHLGYFDNPELAGQAYQVYAKNLHGDFHHA